MSRRQVKKNKAKAVQQNTPVEIGGDIATLYTLILNNSKSIEELAKRLQYGLDIDAVVRAILQSSMFQDLLYRMAGEMIQHHLSTGNTQNKDNEEKL